MSFILWKRTQWVNRVHFQCSKFSRKVWIFVTSDIEEKLHVHVWLLSFGVEVQKVAKISFLVNRPVYDADASTQTNKKFTQFIQEYVSTNLHEKTFSLLSFVSQHILFNKSVSTGTIYFLVYLKLFTKAQYYLFRVFFPRRYPNVMTKRILNYVYVVKINSNFFHIYLLNLRLISIVCGINTSHNVHNTYEDLYIYTKLRSDIPKLLTEIKKSKVANLFNKKPP